MTDRIKDQYEAFPYPQRDPRDEAKRLITGSPSHLHEIDHYCFGGARDFSKPFRALIAGGGTGDGTIMLAQQLADLGCPAEIVHLDVSAAARKIAEARARARGLSNLRFVEGSIFEARNLVDAGDGFDYIDCCGVLHHLDDPTEGLHELRLLLKPEGGIGLMLYGELGRTGVYHVQGLMRLFAEDEPDQTRLKLARKLLKNLPDTNWLSRNPYLADHREGGNAGLYDLLLHSQDRAFRVDEVAEIVILGGLRITTFIEPARYAPENYLSDAALRARVDGLDGLERACFAELLAGNLSKHIFYVVEAANPVEPPEPDEEEAVPVFRDAEAAAQARKLEAGGTVTAKRDGTRFRFPLPRLARAIAERIDGRRTLREIHQDIAAAAPPGPEPEDFYRQFTVLFDALNALNMLYLRFPPNA